MLHMLGMILIWLGLSRLLVALIRYLLDRRDDI